MIQKNIHISIHLIAGLNKRSFGRSFEILSTIQTLNLFEFFYWKYINVHNYI